MGGVVAAAAVVPVSSRTPQWLTFQIGKHHYAVPLGNVREVTREGELLPVPGASDAMLGLRQLRGRIVPVMDGRLRLQPQAPPLEDPSRVRILMLSWAEHVVGLRVDAVGELIHADDADVLTPALPLQRHHQAVVTGELAWQGGSMQLLDINRLFGASRCDDAPT